MKWDDIQEMPCSVARTLSVIGDRWTMLIIRNSFLGTRRFDQFQKLIGLSRHRLADRLNKLVENDILKKVPYQEKPLRYEYKLTRKGVELYPVLMTMARWGDKWMDNGDGPPMEYVHKTCGHKMHMELHCSECGDAINPKEVMPVAGPGMHAFAQKQQANQSYDLQNNNKNHLIS